MKTLVSSAFAVMAAFALNASTHWFDAGIADYESWPEDGSDKAIPGVGTWTNTVAAIMEGDAGGRMLSVSTSRALEFVAAVSQDVANEPAFSTRILMTACAEMPEIEPGAKGAVSVFGEGAATNYYGLAKSATGGTNEWVTLSGVAPDCENDVMLAISYRLGDDDAIEVSYSIDGIALEFPSGSQWAEIAFPEEDFEVTCIGYSGTGLVKSLAGSTVDIEAELVALSIPEIAYMSVTRVSVGGVEIEPDETDGTYAVPAGSLVAVEFEAADGWFLSSGAMTFIAGDENFTLPAEGRPVATAVGEVLRISEVMASNETTLRTAGGKAGFDWVEIENNSDFAVDITGWLISDKAPSKDKWEDIQGSCVVPAHGHLVIFVDSNFTEWNGRDAHAALGLSTSGETISFATKGKTVISTFEFGEQFKDISYGWGHRSRTILDEHSDAQYKVGDGEWTAVRGPVGMSSAENGFQVISYAFNGLYPTTRADVENWIANTNVWRQAPATNSCTTLCFNEGSSTSFSAGAFPGVNGDAFALVCTGTVNIPRAGMWTFGVGSDDGFTAKISRQGRDWAWEYNGTRGYGMTTASFNLPEPGAYDVEIYYWEYNGGACFEFCAAEGAISFDASQFALVGDTNGEIVHAGAYAAKIAADLAPEMVGASDTVEWKSSFALSEAPGEDDGFRLKIRYSDGFAASVNGVEFASVAPDPSRTPSDALNAEFFDIPANLVVAGANTVEITGLNGDIDDTEFFLSPEIVWNKADEELVYFDTPTPKAANDYAGRLGLTPAVTLSEPHGWKTDAFQLTMSCAEDPNAAIYYTTDGTSPTTLSTPYTGPITIDRTTVVRAGVPNADAILQKDVSATYLFVDDVVRQYPNGETPEGFPTYGVDNTNGQVLRYGMANAAITQSSDPDTIRRLYNGFTNGIRTVSLVIDPKNLFDPSYGIYVNASGNGKAWERQTMVEQINPADPADEFAGPCGLRIRGAFSRGAAYPKHSFRLFFKSEYGMSKLKHPVFGDEGAGEFDKLDLRADQNQSYANGDSRETMVHDVFSRDSQRDMGGTYHRTRYFHLFINGVYWGLYQYEERCSPEYAASYNGGEEEDYDIVRTSQPGYSTGTVEGDNAGMANFWNIVYNQGFGANYPNNYNKVRGLNPDGTRNENYPIYLNVTNLLVEMYSAHYAADTDSPASGGMPNNIAAFRNRVDGKGKEDGWMFNRHDAEWSLGFGGGYNSDTCGYGSKAEAGCSVFNPAGIHYELMANAEYRMVAADLFHKFFLREGGAMTAPVAEARFRSRMAEIDEAIVCENARWGRNDFAVTRTHWLDACENICIAFIRNRVPYLKYHYQTRGWYPSIDAPSALDEDGNLVADGTRFESEGKVYLGGAGGTVYYTTDGSDPRLEGGAVASGAQVYDTAATGDEAGIVVPAAGLVLKARVLTGSGEWSALEEVEVVGSNPPSTISSSIRFAEVCGIPADGIKGDTGEYVVLTNTSDTAGFDVSGMNVVVGKRKDIEKSGDAGSKMNIVLPEGSFIAACGSLRLDQADFGIEGGWDKITNGDLILRLYTAGGALVQSSAVDQNNFPTVTDANMLGASLIATDFGAETSESGWRASVSPEYYYLRFLAFDGLPPDSEGDLYEWFALTNLSDTAALDLTGVRVVIGKTAKDGSFDEASSKMNVVIAGGTLAAASSNRFDKASFGPEWDKITNGDIALRLYDAYGLLIQSSALKQKNFSAYYGSGGPGGEDWLVATSFGRVLAESDWAESSSIGGDADKVAEDIAAIEAAKSGDVALPNEADVAIDGNTVTITIGSASDTVEVPAYYTPSYTAGTLSLALNDLALPTIADTLEEETVVIPAIQVVDGEIQLNVTAAESALWYGLKIAASPSAEWDAIEVENWVSGEALTTLTAEADGDAGFYKIVVTDIDPTL